MMMIVQKTIVNKNKYINYRNVCGNNNFNLNEFFLYFQFFFYLFNKTERKKMVFDKQNIKRKENKIKITSHKG